MKIHTIIFNKLTEDAENPKQSRLILKQNTMKNLLQLLKDNQIVELSNDLDIFEIKFSPIRNVFILEKNSAVIKTAKSFSVIENLLPSDLELTDIF